MILEIIYAKEFVKKHINRNKTKVFTNKDMLKMLTYIERKVNEQNRKEEINSFDPDWD